MQPAICINPNGLTGKFRQVARFLDGFQHWEQAFNSIRTAEYNVELVAIPEIPIFTAKARAMKLVTSPLPRVYLIHECGPDMLRSNADRFKSDDS